MDKDLQADIDEILEALDETKYGFSRVTDREIWRAALDRIVARILEPSPDFDAIAKEIESNAYQSGTFFPALCVETLRKHFGKEELDGLRKRARV